MRLRDKLGFVDNARGASLPSRSRGSPHSAREDTFGDSVRDLLPVAERASLPSRGRDDDDWALEGSDREKRIVRLRALIGEVAARDRERVRPPPSAPGTLRVGERRNTPAGVLHLIERFFDPEQTHGRVPLRAALSASSGCLGAVACEPALAGIELARMLILDTETTGLAGGSGTVPFLVGLGSFEDGALKTEQLFLHNLGCEAPLLHHLAQRLAAASCLVTYNGRSFDWPLLRARFVLNRVPMPELPPHVDLLNCARRVFRARLGSLRLAEVERAVLGFHRDDDIDGAQIPGLYLGYLRGADPDTLLPVLRHNELDVIALAALLWRLCAHFERVRVEDDPLDHLAYARLALRASDLERARAFADAVLETSELAAHRTEALWLLARVWLRRGEPASAIGTLERALHSCACEEESSAVHLALARLHEHKVKAPGRAYYHARRTLAAEGSEAHGRRLGRLHRRLLRLAGA
jgi:uncharacterized protein YprB with RNaseH-like and TPR domain